MRDFEVRIGGEEVRKCGENCAERRWGKELLLYLRGYTEQNEAEEGALLPTPARGTFDVMVVQTPASLGILLEASFDRRLRRGGYCRVIVRISVQVAHMSICAVTSHDS